jgi:hypothetical protein
MLAMADSKGRIFGSIPGLANRARVSVDSARTAINTFLSPDPDSRTPVAEGRRIEPIDGGWRLINHDKYRSLRDEESAKEAKRKYINERRAKERAEKVDKTVDNSIYSRSQSNAVERCRDNAEAEAEKEESKSTPIAVDESFKAFWQAYPNKKGKGAAEKAWKKARINGELETILLAIEVQKKSSQWSKDSGQFIPHPSTWLNERRWEDEASAPVVKERGFVC